MEPSLKRPRLSIFHQQPTDDALDNARYSNDMTLKNRFESIFAKYSQDFTGIGDEIDIVTGEVVVNNGHLESIEDETDPGLENRSGGFTTAGRSILRAMTAALDPSLPGPDDVLASIETIAENAAISGEGSPEESGDDLFETTIVSESLSESSDQEVQQNPDYPSIDPYNSDSDSLFEENTIRSGSVDSLFRDRSEIDANTSQSLYESALSTEPSLPPLNHAADDDEILERFGPNIGKEVLSVISQRKEAHIEPIWRIPVQIEAPQDRRRTPVTFPSSSVDADPSPKNKKRRSLWHASAVSRRRARSKEQPPQQARDESVDPLQEDFSSDAEDQDWSKSQSSDISNQSGGEHEAEHDPMDDLLDQISATGDCPYCQVNFRNKSGVMAHWDRVLRRPRKSNQEHDPHDQEMMRKVRATALPRVRLPRLIVYDFRTMVELHEGAEMSFDDIVTSKILRTRKTGLQLQDIYNKHRTPFGSRGTLKSTKRWSTQEEEKLQTLCQNPLATMATLRRSLKSRDELEIGNHLAEFWLSQLGPSQGTDALKLQQETMDSSRFDSAVAMQDIIQTHEDEEDIQVKCEDSDDDLFDVV